MHAVPPRRALVHAAVVAFAVAMAATPAVAAPSAASGRQLVAVTLPSRHPRAATLAVKVRQVAASLARAEGSTVADGPAAVVVADTQAILLRAQEMAHAGKLDIAADLLDGAIEVAVQAPHQFASSSTLVDAHVARAAIAVARGETERAEQLIEQLLRWDPTFALTAAEQSPSLVDVYTRVRARIDVGENPMPALRPQDLGALCGAGDVIVAQYVAGGSVRIGRYRDCKRISSVRAPALDPLVLPGLGAPPLDLSARRQSHPPLWRRSWVWIAAGLAAGATGVIVWQTAGGSDDLVEVVPQL